MPCDSSYLAPRPEEARSCTVIQLLQEVGLDPGPYDRDYGNVKKLDQHTRTLCSWCKQYPNEVKNKSLELQIWWRDHQIEDARKAEAQKRQLRNARLVEQARSKLTKEEYKALKEHLR
jgi:hypothetical protein